MLIKINGRSRYFGRIETVTEIRPGHYEVTAGQFTLKVEGGRSSGGTANEWLIHADGVIFNRTVLTKSLMESLRLIDQI